MSFRIITIDELLKELDKYKHSDLQIHHTWKPDHSNFNGKNHIALQQGMYNYHVNTRGWDNIGQHVTLCPDGLFVTGRPFNDEPIGIAGYNDTGLVDPFMVEMIGNFDTNHDKLEGKQLDSILKLANYFDNKGRYIRFHRENASKTCPGNGLNKVEFMKKVRALDKKEKFEDIKGHWAEKHIRKVLEEGKMAGYPDGSFKPDAPITRAEFATLVALNRI